MNRPQCPCRTRQRTASLASVLLAVALGAAVGAFAQPLPVPPWASKPNLAQRDYDLKPRQLARGTWVIEGAVADFSLENGCNIINTAFIDTGDGVVVINTGPSRHYGEQQRRAIARITRAPVRKVWQLNLHPDYFFGHQAWADTPTEALAGTIAGARAEGAAYADNLYRLCGDWMQGTEPTPARHALETKDWPVTVTLGAHRFELWQMSGHTDDDLVVLDTTTGILFAGGLVFAERVPTTPHARFGAWLASLDRLEDWVRQGRVKWVVPAHGPVHEGAAGIRQTRDWLRWLQQAMDEAAEQGLDLSEVLERPAPERFTRWAAYPAELQRTLSQWYPAAEKKALTAPRP
ncbi:MAG: quinoprotein relay system zinc metallohydrolase 1 [Casimicrobiaceae bacterium]